MSIFVQKSLMFPFVAQPLISSAVNMVEFPLILLFFRILLDPAALEENLKSDGIGTSSWEDVKLSSILDKVNQFSDFSCTCYFRW